MLTGGLALRAGPRIARRGAPNELREGGLAVRLGGDECAVVLADAARNRAKGGGALHLERTGLVRSVGWRADLRSPRDAHAIAAPGACDTCLVSDDAMATADVVVQERRWADLLGRLAIPAEILESAEESPYRFDPAVFEAAALGALDRHMDSAADRAARDALPPGGSVLDVGVGGGAASLRLGRDGARLVGVDASRELLEVFSNLASAGGIDATAVEGTWPDVAASVPVADVVVCHNVVYNVPALGAFTRALGRHATARVVIELTAEHPLAWMRPYWRALHGLDRPDGPTADDAIAVVAATGADLHVERSTRSVEVVDGAHPDAVGQLARRLCVARDRDGEVARLMEEHPPPTTRAVVTLWWDA